MAAFDSIINVEEWISDYFLTTDETKGDSFGKRVDECMKAWKKEDAERPVSPWATLLKHRNALQKALSVLEAENPGTLAPAYELIHRIFSYPAVQATAFQRDAKEIRVSAGLDAAGSAVVLHAHIAAGPESLPETSLLTPVEVDGKEQRLSVSALVGELFITDTPPQFVVVLAGPWVFLAERDSWPLGRFLAIDLGLAVERKDTKAKGELARVTVALAMENIARGADGTTWWLQTLEQSHNHSVSVSADLREAIKRSIETIGNDVMGRRKARELSPQLIDGHELGNQALRYLYRILFLLFAESSPELEILPTGDADYDEGYGMSRLRELIVTEPVTERARQGTHLYQSLQLLFDQVNHGHNPDAADNPLRDDGALVEGLTFRNLDADLFKPEQTSYIDEVGLSNEALYQVLVNLLLTKEKRGSDRGYISYATLGVTELGQVYEGLMSYTGFIAEENLFEVAPKGDASKGSWVIPVSKVQENPDYVPEDSYVLETDDAAHGGYLENKKKHHAGSFVFRQSSRDRERSASFYSPPVITEFTVGQAIEELEATGRIATADDILTLKICEPAMGSGAFAVEAVNQLAELYLTKKQAELGQQVAPEQRTAELQKVKAYLALHQVYGVDLNKTAVELAEISLWLDTMTSELTAPWFGLHLRHGNSLVGATRSTVTAASARTKKYLSEVPHHHPVTTVQKAIVAGEDDAALKGRLHHFLLPAKGWGAAAEAKDLKDIAAEEIRAMKAWRKSIQLGFTADQLKTLTQVSAQVEQLWKFALVRLQIAEDQIRRPIKLWGRDVKHRDRVVLRKQIEQELFSNMDGAYQRLRLAMNAWNALWFWPITKTAELPDAAEWVAAMKDILGIFVPDKKQDVQLGSDMRWDELNSVEELNKLASGRMRFADLLAAHPWLSTVMQVAQEQAFFHWDLDFAQVMATGGFDFQVGNPPWVRPRTDVDGLLAEHDPWFKLAHKPTQAEKKARRERLIDVPGVKETLSKGLAEAVVTSAVLGDPLRYPHLVGQQPDLYRGFMERTWANASDEGIVALIHPESHFTEKKAAPLRAGAYLRLRRHWQFINELVLFDVHHLVAYGVHVYGSKKPHPSFLTAASLYHPKTIADSFAHDGSGSLPGFKDDNGNWDLRPHADRIITGNEDTLRVWNSILEEPGTPLLHTRTVYSVNSEAAAVLAKLAEAPRVKDLGLQFSGGWHESGDKKKGYFDTSWQHPESWSKVILQGPHFGVSTPMIKQPNPTMKNNQDWSEIDLEAMPADFIPATAYLPNPDKTSYAADYGTWLVDGNPVPVIDQYRVAWRRMAATTGFRTLYPALIPPGSAHVHPVQSAGSPDSLYTLQIAGASMSSFLTDFFIRSAGGGDLHPSVIETVPIANKMSDHIVHLYLRLNCLTEAYAPLWEEITGEKWTVDTPLRNARERWHAQNEIDAIVALSLGVTLDELMMIYRTQFPVMRRYDREWLYDANGRRVAGDVEKLHKKGGDLSEAERTWTHPQSGATYVFEYPFAPLDREADLTAAYHKYAQEM